MAEPLATWAEVWPVAADRAGLWLLGDDALRPALPVMSDETPYDQVRAELHAYGMLDRLIDLHQTSSRMDGPRFMTTHIAAVDAGDPVLVLWPHAQPISLDLANTVGKPPAHGPAELPDVRYIDVLYHGLRHFRLLLDYDARFATQLGPVWRRHLRSLDPALYHMFDDEHPLAA